MQILNPIDDSLEWRAICLVFMLNFQVSLFAWKWNEISGHLVALQQLNQTFASSKQSRDVQFCSLKASVLQNSLKTLLVPVCLLRIGANICSIHSGAPGARLDIPEMVMVTDFSPKLTYSPIPLEKPWVAPCWVQTNKPGYKPRILTK